MRMYDLILKKRQGKTLTEQELTYLVTGFTKNEIPDYQMSALLMAIYFQGLSHDETVMLTLAMANSGDQVDLSIFGDKTVDKHSTGGVGDKTTLIVAPIAAACGAVVAKMSGRGLGHTGGTVDKLESISGFRTELSQSEFLNVVKATSIAVVGQSGNLAPADKKLYALRDVTATVENASLIASSIMSKKLAAGSKNIILDVKCGAGAFMNTIEDATALAKTMVAIGKDAGRNVSAVLTNMNMPLGHNIGNALEVSEAVETLRGNGPADLWAVCFALATQMVRLACGVSREEAATQVNEAVASGAALNKLSEMVCAQGGNPAVIADPSLFPKATTSQTVLAQKSGYVTAVNALLVGNASVCLGAGRSKLGDRIDYSAGIVLHKKPGDAVTKGESLATLYTSTSDTNEAHRLVQDSYQLGTAAPKIEPLIYGVIE